MVKIAIVGPESSGKSELASSLALHFDCGYIEEVAREHLKYLDRPYVESDLLDIALDQRRSLELENERIKEIFSTTDPTGNSHANSNTHRLTLCDTDMITIRIWSQEKFGRVDPVIEHLVRTVHYDHWLLCRPDIPWEADPLRENPHDRDRLFDIYEETLKELGRPYSVIEGDRKQRMRKATALIAMIIQYEEGRSRTQ